MQLQLNYPSSPCFAWARPRTCEGCNSRRPCPWPGCFWDASRIRGAAGWSDCPASTPTACFDMTGRCYSDGSCSDSVAPCRNCRSTSSAWWRSTGCRRWRCPKAATCHLCTDYFPNLSTPCLCRLWAERCNQECRRCTSGRGESCGGPLINGERVSR